MGKLLDNPKLKKKKKDDTDNASVCPIVKSKFQFYSFNQSPNINSIYMSMLTLPEVGLQLDIQIPILIITFAFMKSSFFVE